MSHLSYCISCWGGIPNWETYFQIKKYVCDCFVAKTSLMTVLNFTLPVHAFVIIINTEHKNYSLEHTKPLFNELNLENFYYNHTFVEIFMFLK